MGKENDVVLEYLDGNEYFADLFNGSYFDGDPVIGPRVCSSFTIQRRSWRMHLRFTGIITTRKYRQEQRM